MTIRETKLILHHKQQVARLKKRIDIQTYKNTKTQVPTIVHCQITPSFIARVTASDELDTFIFLSSNLSQQNVFY